jgi:hypothetical protein
LLDFLEIGEQQARSYSATMTLIFRLRDGPNKSRDRNVAAAHPDLSSRVFQEEIETSQIAPTILARARHRYDELKSVREQQTRPLPGFDD